MWEIRLQRYVAAGTKGEHVVWTLSGYGEPLKVLEHRCVCLRAVGADKS